MVLDGKIALGPFVEEHELSELPELFEAAKEHKTKVRPVVVPGGAGS